MVEMEKKRICPRCFNILKGMPKKDEVSVPSGIASTIKVGNSYQTVQHTTSQHTGKYWCGECRVLSNLADFREFRIPKGMRKSVNKSSKKLYEKGIDKPIRFKHLLDCGLEVIK